MMGPAWCGMLDACGVGIGDMYGHVLCADLPPGVERGERKVQVLAQTQCMYYMDAIVAFNIQWNLSNQDLYIKETSLSIKDTRSGSVLILCCII